MIKLIIAGGRDFADYELLKFEVKKFIIEEIKTRKNLEIVSGKARGADSLGERFAEEHSIPVKPFPVAKEDWNKHGKKAGHLRNEEMAKYAEGNFCILFWDGESRGTKNMLENAARYGLKTRIVKYGKD